MPRVRVVNSVTHACVAPGGLEDALLFLRRSLLDLRCARARVIRANHRAGARRRLAAPMSAAKEVTWEDQQRICAFSRMNARAHEINSEIKHKEKQIDDLDEASTELAVNDEDDACVLMGECFVKMDNEQADAKVEAMLTRERAALEALKGERKVLREGMEELKKVRLARRTARAFDD